KAPPLKGAPLPAPLKGMAKLAPKPPAPKAVAKPAPAPKVAPQAAADGGPPAWTWTTARTALMLELSRDHPRTPHLKPGAKPWIPIAAALSAGGAFGACRSSRFQPVL